MNFSISWNCPLSFILYCMSGLIVSKYTYLFISSKGKHLVYNSRTNVFLEVSSDVYRQLLACQKEKEPIDALDANVLALLKDKKVVVRLKTMMYSCFHCNMKRNAVLILKGY